ncbi:MAG: RDD family protein [Oligoflexia bacterium]|nr:RDD family protein [Oligoflexia bacterium]MBF0364792.1 RDD family protein [Oligoflexia bacterium]
MEMNKDLSSKERNVGKIAKTGKFDNFAEFENFENNDELLFRPLTEGLGFHQDDKEREHLDRMFKPDLKLNLKRSKSEVTLEKAKALPPLGIQKIAQNPPSLPLKKEERARVDRVAVEASKLQQSAAFGLDIFFIVLATTLLLGLLFAIAVILGGAPEMWRDRQVMGGLLQEFWGGKNIFYLGAIYLVNYFLYFVFLDLTERGTLGKIVCKIQLTAIEKGQNLTLWSVMTRAGTSLFSFFALAIPTLFDINGKLSGTKLIKR